MSEKKTILTEAYKINLEIPKEKELYEELLRRSNNKSGLVKDALTMYLALIKKGAYVSPFLNNNTSDWDTILKNLSLDSSLGRPAQVVKEEVIEQKIEQQEQQKQQEQQEQQKISYNQVDNTKETLSLEDDDEDEFIEEDEEDGVKY